VGSVGELRLRRPRSSTGWSARASGRASR